ncbi:hypothetical protein LTR66_005472 [Elasticomyces elasticus]|nr:hypothetical protein LTR66_005472 [Elasticomyces elasticus]
MPTYFATGVSARLSVCDLASSITPDPELRNRREAYRKIPLADAAIATGRKLRERPINVDEDDGVMSFLGPDKDMPMFIVHAGRELFDAAQDTTTPPKALSKRQDSGMPSAASTTPPLMSTPLGDTPSRDNDPLAAATVNPVLEACEESRAAQSASHSEPALFRDSLDAVQTVETPHPVASAMTPLALALTLTIAPKSLTRPDQLTHQDIKVEVFYNGLFASTSLFASRTRSSRDKIECSYTGRRIQTYMERPWVIGVGPRASDEAFIDGTTSGDGTSFWTSIGQALMLEVKSRGPEKCGKKSPSCEYLEALAKLEMPTALSAAQRPGQPGIGIIDVVVTYGRGRKVDSRNSSLISQPSVMKAPNHNVCNATPNPRSEAVRQQLLSSDKKPSGVIGVVAAETDKDHTTPGNTFMEDSPVTPSVNNSSTPQSVFFGTPKLEPLYSASRKALTVSNTTRQPLALFSSSPGSALEMSPTVTRAREALSDPQISSLNATIGGGGNVCHTRGPVHVTTQQKQSENVVPATPERTQSQVITTPQLSSTGASLGCIAQQSVTKSFTPVDDPETVLMPPPASIHGSPHLMITRKRGQTKPDETDDGPATKRQKSTDHPNATPHSYTTALAALATAEGAHPTGHLLDRIQSLSLAGDTDAAVKALFRSAAAKPRLRTRVILHGPKPVGPFALTSSPETPLSSIRATSTGSASTRQNESPSLERAQRNAPVHPLPMSGLVTGKHPISSTQNTAATTWTAITAPMPTLPTPASTAEGAEPTANPANAPVTATPPSTTSTQATTRQTKKRSQARTSRPSARAGSARKPRATPTATATPKPNRSATATPKTKSRASPAELPASHFVDAFPTPWLCRRSVLTYAGAGAESGGDGGCGGRVCRQIKVELEGQFAEAGLLVGFRFVVG